VKDMDLDGLIKYELDGKAQAVAEYDRFLWKIRTGYAAFIYGSTGVIVALVSKKVLPFNDFTFYSLGVLMVGWSFFALLMDYSFLFSKMRVVNDRDKLIEFMFKLTNDEPLNNEELDELKRCLKNSGERKEKVDLKTLAARWRPIIYYGGTAIVCLSAITILTRAL
jgi:hypothetical protein